MSKKDGGPAFPETVDFKGCETTVYHNGGMALRDYFVAHGPWKINDVLRFSTEKMTRQMASVAVANANLEYADAMLAERDK